MLESTYIPLRTKKRRINPRASERLNAPSDVINVLVPGTPTEL